MKEASYKNPAPISGQSPRCGMREILSDDRRPLYPKEFNPPRIVTCGLLHPKKRFNDHNQAIVGWTDRYRHALNARHGLQELLGQAVCRKESQCECVPRLSY